VGARAAQSAPRLRLVITDRLGRPAAAPGLAAWLSRVAPATARGEVSVALVSDRVVRALNERYRGKNTPTDVLSFPHRETFPRAAHPAHLGDLVISTQTARRQARAAGHSYGVELKILALHGLLHLLGYDHDSPSDRGRMSRIERRLRATGGLREGLIERGGLSPRRRERARPHGRRRSERP